ncbi:hypothetical protein ACFS4T_10010 [Pseudomonas lini]
MQMYTDQMWGGRLACDGGLITDRDFFDGVHIRFFGSGGYWFRFYSESLSKSAKVTKALLPLHSVPRPGSACPHSGIAPGAATAASLPRCPLRNTCVRPLGKGQQITIKIKSQSNGNDKINSFASKPAPTKKSEHIRSAFHHSTGRALARLQFF